MQDSALGDFTVESGRLRARVDQPSNATVVEKKSSLFSLTRALYWWFRFNCERNIVMTFLESCGI